jgi:hypothetical protein
LPLEVPAVLMQVGVPCLQQAESERGSEGELRLDQRAALSQPARDYTCPRLLRQRSQPGWAETARGFRSSDSENRARFGKVLRQIH